MTKKKSARLALLGVDKDPTKREKFKPPAATYVRHVYKFENAEHDRLAIFWAKDAPESSFHQFSTEPFRPMSNRGKILAGLTDLGEAMSLSDQMNPHDDARPNCFIVAYDAREYVPNDIAAMKLNGGQWLFSDNVKIERTRS